jgi:DNA ligase D-like protein (predicted 3'-phosphoesterase)
MPRFVVHRHEARKAGLHYDLRLEIGGVLKSWAFRKELPDKPSIKRLGIEQPDHELSYIDFEGVIEEGYGAGLVEIWDKEKSRSWSMRLVRR